ncbi:MAG: type IV pilus secretin PilQ, partial [Thermodesulfobacteriota bacterium]
EEAKKAAKLAKAEAKEKDRVEAERLAEIKRSDADARKKAKAESRRRERTIKKAEALMKAYADREFKTVKKSAEPVRTVQAQLDEALGTDPDIKQYTGKLLDLDMVGVDIKDILKLIAEVSDLNIIAGEDVTGSITMRLKNVPWDQAFDLILLTKGLDKVQIGNVVRVASVSKIRKEKEEKLAAQNARKKVAPLVTEYIQINYEEASNLEKHIKEVLSDRGSVTSHESTNTIIVRDVGENIVAAKDVVTKLDRVVPQVLIEARIVEAETSFARDLGIQWGLDFADQPHTNIFGSAQDAFGQAPHDPSVREAVKDGGGVYPSEKTNWPNMAGVTNYAVNLPATGVAGALGAMGFVFGTSGDNPAILDLRLTAGEQAGVLKTISRPRITTLDNKEAKIEQGESIPFETTSASGTATTFIDANLSLTVTPQITPDGSVLMQIKASRNSIGTFKTSSGEPSINKKEAQTEVLVKDGETTVIGGIVISDTNSSEQGIPYLKNIPGLGWLFKSKSVSDKQTELLIFITPTIIKNDATIG